MNTYHPDTICAVATPPGRGGIGVVRVSGDKSYKIAKNILNFTPKTRHAHYSGFYVRGDMLDQGIAIFFRGPESFTGEDILELQGHGGPVILDQMLQEIIRLGARLARPGEFSERAFLNDKLDLTQAEAIADLIEASSRQAAKQALSSLKGEFSKKIDIIVDKLIYLRMYVESSIDFPEEEIDFLSDGKVAAMLNDIIDLTEQLLHQAEQGARLREGIKVVIAGRPNAGKSSLLNRLAQKDLAIVTDIAGTTRDVLREQIHIDGLPLHIADTAGLHDSPDQVEKIGIERAWREIEAADRILLVIDSTDSEQVAVESHWTQFTNHSKYTNKLTVIYNKIDRSSFNVSGKNKGYSEIAISALNGNGIEQLKQHLKATVGYDSTVEGSFSARRRHLEAIKHAIGCLHDGQKQLNKGAAGEFLSEDLKYAQNHLGEITGKFTPDELLGRIFSNFCIGK